jgi:GAF domain-containing protein
MAFRPRPGARTVAGMTDTGHERRDLGLAEALVELADTLVDDFDTVDFLHTLTARTIELVDAEAAGVMVTDQRGRLRVLAASSEQARLLELFELQNDEGPCLDCFRTGRAVPETDLAEPGHPWPLFAGEALAAGHRTVSALPLRLRDHVVGALNLFGGDPGRLSTDDLRLAQALADVATIGLLQQRTVRRRELLAEQLQTALHSRVVLEQAKGVLSERGQMTMDEAFSRLRAYARAHGTLLSDVARGVVDETIRVPLDIEAASGG